MRKLSLIIGLMLAACSSDAICPNNKRPTKRTWVEQELDKATCIWWQQKEICVCTGERYDYWIMHVPDHVCSKSD